MPKGSRQLVRVHLEVHHGSSVLHQLDQLVDQFANYYIKLEQSFNCRQ